MQIVRIDPEHPNERRMQDVVGVLRDGGVVAYPTDTVYGIGCALANKRAIERLYRLKDKSRRQPLSLLVADISQASRYGQVDNGAFRVLRAFAPGPFCWELESTKEVPRVLLHRRTTTGIRIPDSLFCQRMLAILGTAIVNTTAAAVDAPPLRDPHEIEKRFRGRIDMVVDGGMGGDEKSTVVSLVGAVPAVLRQGKGHFDWD